MGEALRWLILGHLAFAVGLLPWVFVLGIVLRKRRPADGLRPTATNRRRRASAAPPKLPQPPLMDLTVEPFDPSPPAWGGPLPYAEPPAGSEPGVGTRTAGPSLAGDSDEGGRRSAPPQQRRLALAEARDLARSALLRLAGSGYYAFEDLLVSGVGAIDQLVVGPAGLRVLVVAPERGHVWREEGGEITYSTDARVDLEAGKIEGTFESPEEDFDAIARALADDVSLKLGAVEADVWPVIVFPHAEVYTGPGGGHGIVSVWNLADVLDYPDHRLPEQTAEEIVPLIADAYGREPWMRPTPDHEPCPDA